MTAQPDPYQQPPRVISSLNPDEGQVVREQGTSSWYRCCEGCPVTVSHETVGLVGCGAAKLAHPAPARDLYTGSVFTATSRHARTAYDRWFILSAKHQLLHPDQLVDPYDETLNAKTRQQVELWSNRVAEQVRQQVPEGAHLFIHAGRAYWQHLEPLLTPLYPVTVPCRGLKMGEAGHWHAEVWAGRIPRFGDPTLAQQMIDRLERNRTS